MAGSRGDYFDHGLFRLQKKQQHGFKQCRRLRREPQERAHHARSFPMNNNMRFNLKDAFLILGYVFLGSVINARATTSPTSPASSIVKVFEMRASVNSDCSSPTVVFKTASPAADDLSGIPTFGSGAIPDGTYHCLMFHIDDQITVVPQATTGSCTAGSAVTMDIYSTTDDVSFTPEGVKIPATTGEDDPWVYFSDSSQAAASNNCFEPNTNGCACSGPCPLSALTLTSDQTHRLIINLDNRINGSGASCALLLPPAMPQSIMSIK
jgi:hypothetical protein